MSARKDLWKKIKERYGIEAEKWEAFSSVGATLADFFADGVERTIALYRAKGDDELTTLALSELRDNGVAVRYGVGFTPEEAAAQGVECVERLCGLATRQVDVVVWLEQPEKKAFTALRKELARCTTAEPVSLWDMVAVQDYERKLFAPMKVLFDKADARFCMVDWPYAVALSDVSSHGDVFSGEFSAKEYQKNPERFARLYDDLPEYDDAYIRTIFEERPIIAWRGSRVHADCSSAYVNIVNHERVTTDQPETFDRCVYITGGCNAFGFGTDDAHTTASYLQRMINNHVGISSEVSVGVRNLGVWNAQDLFGHFAVLNDCKREKMVLYIGRGDWMLYVKGPDCIVPRYLKRTLAKMGIDYVCVADVLEEEQRARGCYIDGEHVNHRGHQAVARKVFDAYLKPLLGEKVDDVEALAFLSQRSLDQLLELEREGHALGDVLKDMGASLALHVDDKYDFDAKTLCAYLKGKHRLPVVAIVGEKTLMEIPAGVENLTREEFHARGGAWVVLTTSATVPTLKDGTGKAKGVEWVSIADVIALVHDAHHYYPALLKDIAAMGAGYACLVFSPKAQTWQKASWFNEGVHSAPFVPSQLQERYGYYAANLYDEVPLLSQEYLKEVFLQGVSPKAKAKRVTLNGKMRQTTEQPVVSDRTIHVVGSGLAFGIGVEDAHTIASFLQRQLNRYEPNGARCRVVNHGVGDFAVAAHDAYVQALPSLMKEATSNDALICMYEKRYSFGEREPHVFECLRGVLAPYGVQVIDLAYALQLAQRTKPVFVDDRHVNYRGASSIATKVFFDFVKGVVDGTIESLVKKEEQATSNTEALNVSEDAEFMGYIEYLQRERAEEDGLFGCVVMNCNPFSKGHRYLVERAAAEVDHLYVFVVEEDRSFFKFEDRLRLVCEALSDMKKVTVLRSGKFIISTVTFPGYFSKDSVQEVTVDTSLDLSLFGEHIAPALGITVRFAGKEPLCAVTRQYNRAMRETLPEYGVDFVEFDRIEREGAPISASRIRALLKDRDFEAIKKLVPECVLAYLREHYRDNA